MSATRRDPDEVYDPGLQVERTLLAWRRTCLSFGVASLVGMRFVVAQLGLLAVVIGVIGAGLSILAYVLAVAGYRRAHVQLRTGGTLTRGGGPMLLATIAVLSVGVLCVAHLARGLLAV